MSRSQNIYDDPHFFEGYKRLRDDPINANNLEEKPALFSLSPDLTGKAVLDLGCGYGENCAMFRALGASKVVGVDISEKMLDIAIHEHPDITFIRGDISDLSFLDGGYDVIFSSLALHYIANFNSVIQAVYDLLNEGGIFIFSQEHPLTTAPITINGSRWEKDENGEALHYKLTDYGISGKRCTHWIVDGVEKYHRTFSEIVNALSTAGFRIEAMLEPVPREDTLRAYPQRKRYLHKPIFLLIKAVK